MFEAIIFVSILFVFLATFIFWCCEKKRDLDTRIIGGAIIVYCFISVFAQTYFLPILEIHGGDKRLSLQIQFTALVIGFTAAIIAFRNYRRKSGSELLADIVVKKHNDIGYISEIMMQNCKDKATFIFAIDLIVNGNRVRIKTYNKPHVLSAYQTDILEFFPVFKYESDLKLSEEDIINSRIECITEHGFVFVKRLGIDKKLSSQKYVKALRLDKKYQDNAISNASEYIIVIKIFYPINQESESKYIGVRIVDNNLKLIDPTDDFYIQVLENIKLTHELIGKFNQGIEIDEELDLQYQKLFIKNNSSLQFALSESYYISNFIKIELHN